MSNQELNRYIIILFGMTATGIITVAYAKGLLNQFIRDFASIVSCAFEVMFTNIFLGWISKTSDAIERHITIPINSFIDKIPQIIKALCITLVGVSIFALDHFYNTKIFAEDEATFFKFIIMGGKYWVTDYALYFGGPFLVYGLLYLAILIIGFILSLLDHPIRITIVIRK